MRIGDLAAQTGVSARSLRYYEEQGDRITAHLEDLTRARDALDRLIAANCEHRGGAGSR